MAGFESSEARNRVLSSFKKAHGIIGYNWYNG